MNEIVVIKTVSGAIGIGIAVIALIYSRAPTWRHLRTFAAIAFLSGLHAFSGAIILSLGPDPAPALFFLRINIFLAIVVAALWLVLSRQVTTKNYTYIDHILIGILLLGALLYLVSDVLIYDVASYPGGRIHTPVLSTLGYIGFAIGLFSVCVTGYRFTRSALQTKNKQALIQFAGFVLFFIFAVDKVLVSIRLIALPSVNELGLTVLLVTVAIGLSDRFRSDANHLAEVNSGLEKAIFERSEELLRAREKLLTAERHGALGQLATGVGHEINNPLSYVAGNLSYLQEMLSKREQLEEEKEAIDEAMDGVRRIAKITVDLTGFVTESKKNNISKIGKVIEKAIRMTKAQTAHSLQFTTEFSTSLNACIDEGRLTQVIINLLANAVDASTTIQASETLPIEISVKNEEDNDMVCIAVSDHGCGIEKQDLIRVFDPLFSTKDVGKGTGLGLFVCKGIIDNAGGTMEVRSTKNAGTTMFLRIPSTSAEPTTETAVALQDKNNTILNIYVVDDEPHIGRVLTRILKSHRVHCETESKKALKHLISGATYDIILCDLMMPGMSGMSLYTKVQQFSPKIASSFVLISGGAVGAEAEEFVRGSELPLVPKPFDPKTLNRSLLEIAKRRTESNRSTV